MKVGLLYSDPFLVSPNDTKCAEWMRKKEQFEKEANIDLEFVNIGVFRPFVQDMKITRQCDACYAMIKTSCEMSGSTICYQQIMNVANRIDLTKLLFIVDRMPFLGSRLEEGFIGEKVKEELPKEDSLHATTKGDELILPITDGKTIDLPTKPERTKVAVVFPADHLTIYHEIVHLIGIQGNCGSKDCLMEQIETLSLCEQCKREIRNLTGGEIDRIRH